MDYVSNRVFDGTRPLSAGDAAALRSMHMRAKSDHRSSLFAALVAIPAILLAYFVRR